MITLALPSFFSSGTQGAMEQYIRAEISYYGWDVLTRSRTSLNAVREASRIKIVIYDSPEIARFVKWLYLEDMKDASDVRPEDPRLVIDLFQSNNQRTTFYASRFNLISEDNKRKRSIDESFREKFRFLQ